MASIEAHFNETEPGEMHSHTHTHTLRVRVERKASKTIIIALATWMMVRYSCSTEITQ